MSIRIKHFSQAPLEAQEHVAGNAAMTQAAARAYVDNMESLILAAGYERTEDTGQLDTSAVVVPASNNSDQGYRLYRLVDEYSATSPLVIKVTFGHRARWVANTNSRRMRVTSVTAAFSSDGAGSLTGHTCQFFYTDTANAVNNTTFIGAQNQVSWRKNHTTLVAAGVSSAAFLNTDSVGTHTASCVETMFAVSRSRDKEGNIILGSFNLYGSVPPALAGAGFAQLWCKPLAFLLTGAGVKDCGGYSVVMPGPAETTTIGDNSLPVLFPCFSSVSEDLTVQLLEGIYGYRNASALGVGVQVTAEGPDGDKTYMPIGFITSAIDSGKINQWFSSFAGSVTLPGHPGYNLSNNHLGIALDWDD